MSISLALISGKGGCGKTTLALSMSQMLASAGLKVLLIDCDMSTHGATYFFENMLKEKEKILTVADLFSNTSALSSRIKKPVFAKKNIDFIPSCVYLAQDTQTEIFINMNLDVLNPFFEKYDVVIFDCQAGWSALTKEITKISNKNLVVMELDAVTSSSTRILIAQLGNLLDSEETYQVFNKITEEDFEVYKLVTHGTFFKNLTPIRYDLSIKRAFAFNELPVIDIENTAFSNNIFDLTYDLFLEYRDKLIKVMVDFKLSMKERLELELDSLFTKRKKEEKVRKLSLYSKIIISFTYVVLSICTITLIDIPSVEFLSHKLYLVDIITGALIGLGSLKFYEFFKAVFEVEESETKQQILKIKDELKDVKKFLNLHQEHLHGFYDRVNNDFYFNILDDVDIEDYFEQD